EENCPTHTRTPPEQERGGVSGGLSLGGNGQRICGAPLWRTTADRARMVRFVINSIFRAVSLACLDADGSVLVTPRATISRPSLMTSQYQRPSLPFGIIRNSTFPMFCWVFRPEIIIRVS